MLNPVQLRRLQIYKLRTNTCDARQVELTVHNRVNPHIDKAMPFSNISMRMERSRVRLGCLPGAGSGKWTAIESSTPDGMPLSMGVKLHEADCYVWSSPEYGSPCVPKMQLSGPPPDALTAPPLANTPSPPGAKM